MNTRALIEAPLNRLRIDGPIAVFLKIGEKKMDLFETFFFRRAAEVAKQAVRAREDSGLRRTGNRFVEHAPINTGPLLGG